MAEWLKAHAWKACIRSNVSGVRIPPDPPKDYKNKICALKIKKPEACVSGYLHIVAKGLNYYCAGAGSGAGAVSEGCPPICSLMS